MPLKLKAFRLPEDLVTKMDEVAKVTERNGSFIVRKALEQYLGEYEDYKIALRRLHDENDKIITLDELRRRIGA